METVNKIALMANLFEAFRSSREKRRQARMAEASDFIRRCDEFQRDQIGRTPPKFNVFSLMTFNADEVRHTKLLAWLLDERASHGQGNLFFTAFLGSLRRIRYPDEHLTGYSVWVERPDFESITDIYVYKPPYYAIAIENKITAPEGPEQLEREYNDLLRFARAFKIPPQNLHGVFLTPDGRKPTTSNRKLWLSLSHDELVHSFEGLLVKVTDDKLRHFLFDLIETTRTWSS